MSRSVVERDFRKDEFKDSKPEDYEFRKDGAVVRKDRWENGLRIIANRVTGGCREFEILNLIDTVQWLLDLIPDREE